ncbi:hypothetical protein BGW80DRAFT_1446673 [Lactifluus volemus]|nr:hypothetical protein BGW80DRAFT_1446673 [Lactifluus volemus]
MAELPFIIVAAGLSSKEFDRKPTLWFKRRSFQLTKDEREKEKEKDVKGRGKDTSVVPVPTVPRPLQAATSSTTVLMEKPSQSDAASSVSGTTPLWRRSSARLGHHVKRLSGSQRSTALGELDAAVTAGSPTESEITVDPPCITKGVISSISAYRPSLLLPGLPFDARGSEFDAPGVWKPTLEKPKSSLTVDTKLKYSMQEGGSSRQRTSLPPNYGLSWE